MLYELASPFLSQAGIWGGGDTLIRVFKLGQIMNPELIAPLSVALRRLIHVKKSFCSFSHTLLDAQTESEVHSPAQAHSGHPFLFPGLALS
jgi:hypothetical protein